MDALQQNDDYNYVFEFNPNLICPMCCFPFVSPTTTDCNHTFCEYCLTKSLSISQKCPSCRSEISKVTPANLIIANLVNELMVYCNEKVNGCQWKGERSQLHNHLECMFVLKKCQNEGCLKMIKKVEYKNHLEIHNPASKLYCIQCKYCQEFIPFLDIESHGRDCGETDSKCPSALFGCTWSGKLKNYLRHINTCTFAQLLPYFNIQESKYRSVVEENMNLHKKMESLTLEVEQLRQELGQEREVEFRKEIIFEEFNQRFCNLELKQDMALLSETSRLRDELSNLRILCQSIQMQLIHAGNKNFNKSSNDHSKSRILEENLRNAGLKHGGYALPNCPFETSTFPPNAKSGFLIYSPAISELENAENNNLSKDEGTVEPQVIDSWLLLASCCLRSFSILFLTIALDRKRTYCSSATTYLLFGQSPNNPSPVLYPSDAASSSSSTYNTHSRLPSSYLPLPSRADANSPIFVSKLVPAESESGDLVENDDDFDEEEESILKKLKTSLMKFPSWNFIFCFLFVLRLTGLLLVIDPPHLRKDFWRFPPALVYPQEEEFYSPIFFYLSLILGLIQCVPVFMIAYYIVIDQPKFAQVVNSSGVSQRKKFGPTIKSKIFLVLGVLFSMIWFVEPSITSRGITNLVLSTGNSSLSFSHRSCPIPPFWWHNESDTIAATYASEFFQIDYYEKNERIYFNEILVQEEMEIPKEKKEKEVALHGWASWVDFTSWCGLVGLWLLFWNLRIEYKRIKDAWVKFIVLQVQETFAFRRTN
ncbi:hypothetical protein HDU92_003986 [Lobulomyces angularis]|nr:hypothetical protein HDU92_003986 [Lobulomyces angularis]